MTVIQLARFVLIEHTGDEPPNHMIVTPYCGAGALREATSQAIFGRRTRDLDAEETEEFRVLWREFWEMGRLRFEGDPGLAWSHLTEMIQ